MTPERLNELFSIEQQRDYIAMMQRRGGLTRQRAEYFVRLWAYLLLKQREETDGHLPRSLDHLSAPKGLVACTHREAADLFYSNKERGSDRAAGMMIDRLAALGLLDKRYDGQTLSLQIRSLPELEIQEAETPIQLIADSFNPRTDAISVANLYARSYAELVRDGEAMAKIARALRTWASCYPVGMRVLRRADNLNVVAASILFPVASESEAYFFQSPSKSFYLTTDAQVDPIQMAPLGDETCTSIYIRAWIIDPSYMNGATLYQLLEDTKQALVRMQADYPGICNLYSLILHPMYEELRRVLGFERICQDSQRSYTWIYLALDRFLQIDTKKALANLRMKDGAS
ncbi:hypothetical protein [Myxacorys almedinensis]|uniref:Uncharacterized protein n=1 Tax=Myxacorys almedinensis A TaxID=2690445 RepID=A0A8J7Z5B3_9CYAN|nr:hypothetical protein [Myxacorys almedinensis]NDJ19645.1 hypothetical protein [Myxacorys almedinensis A]